MKAFFKEWVAIGNAGEMKQTVILSELEFNCTRDEFEAIANTFEDEVMVFHTTGKFGVATCNGLQKMLRHNPMDPLDADENMRSVVTEYYDSKQEVWKRTIKLISVVEE